MADNENVENVAEPSDKSEQSQVESGVNTSEPVDDAEAPIVKKVKADIASKLGWKPETEYTGDPKKWVDFDAYLERTPEIMRDLQERRKQGAAAQAALEAQARELQKRQIEEEIRTATALGDTEAVLQAHQKAYVAAQRPDPVAKAWVDQRSWFNADPQATRMAVQVCDKAVSEGASMEDALKEVDQFISRAFPQYASKTERTAPMVQSVNTRTGSAQPKAKGWGDMPAEVRQVYSSFVEKDMTMNKVSKEDSRAKYAKAYWVKNGK